MSVLEILMALLWLAASASAQSATPQSPAGNAENGKRLFSSHYCYACHGTQGQGGSAGARIAPRPIAFAAFDKYLRRPTGQMPPYTLTVLSDAELTDIYAFLRSVPVATASRNIPLLNQ
jgi:mono/diheme cytochrome c family protein